MPQPVNLSYAIGLPPADAVAYFESKGYAVTANWHEMWQQAHARAFTVAGVAKLDVLEDIRNALAVKLREGKSERWFMQQMEPVLRKKGWWGKRLEQGADDTPRVVRMGSPARLRLIFRQNVQTAYMAGRYRQQRQNAAARPYWQYVAVLDAKTRPAHSALHGRVFAHDDAFWGSHYPPNGWGCRCRVRTLSGHRLQREGLQVESSAGRMVTRQQQVTDSRTGEVHNREVTGYRLPGTATRKGGEEAVAWTDLGFSYNAGAAGMEHMLAQAVQKLEAASHPAAAATVRHLTAGPAFAQWQAAPQGSFPVAKLAPHHAEQLDTGATVARLSSETYAKQRSQHPELQQADYARIQDVVERGEVVRQNPQKLLFFMDDPQGYVTVVKATRKKDELYVVSFWRLSADDAGRQRIIRQLRAKDKGGKEGR